MDNGQKKPAIAEALKRKLNCLLESPIPSSKDKEIAQQQTKTGHSWHDILNAIGEGLSHFSLLSSAEAAERPHLPTSTTQQSVKEPENNASSTKSEAPSSSKGTQTNTTIKTQQPNKSPLTEEEKEIAENNLKETEKSLKEIAEKSPKEMKDALKEVAERLDIRPRIRALFRNSSPWQNKDGSIVGEQNGLTDPKREDISKPRNMLPTSFPDVSALIFAAICTRGQPIEHIGLIRIAKKDAPAKYGLNIETKDGLIITYRASGGASNKTPDDMATVELNFKKYTGVGHPGVIKLKFKFPKSNDSDHDDNIPEEQLKTEAKLNMIIKNASTEKSKITPPSRTSSKSQSSEDSHSKIMEYLLELLGTMAAIYIMKGERMPIEQSSIII